MFRSKYDVISFDINTQRIEELKKEYDRTGEVSKNELYSCSIQFTDNSELISKAKVNPGDREHTIDKIVKVVSGDCESTVDFLGNLYRAVIKVGVPIAVFDRNGLKTSCYNNKILSYHSIKPLI